MKDQIFQHHVDLILFLAAQNQKSAQTIRYVFAHQNLVSFEFGNHIRNQTNAHRHPSAVRLRWEDQIHQHHVVLFLFPAAQNQMSRKTNPYVIAHQYLATSEFRQDHLNLASC